MWNRVHLSRIKSITTSHQGWERAPKLSRGGGQPSLLQGAALAEGYTYNGGLRFVPCRNIILGTTRSPRAVQSMQNRLRSYRAQTWERKMKAAP